MMLNQSVVFDSVFLRCVNYLLRIVFCTSKK